MPNYCCPKCGIAMRMEKSICYVCRYCDKEYSEYFFHCSSCGKVLEAPFPSVPK